MSSNSRADSLERDLRVTRSSFQFTTALNVAFAKRAVRPAERVAADAVVTNAAIDLLLEFTAVVA